MSDGIHPIEFANLYRVEQYSDLENGDITVMTPMDPNVRPRFFSAVTVEVNGHAFPVKFEIEAASLLDACNGFSAAATKASGEFIEKVKEHERTRPRILAPGSARPQ